MWLSALFAGARLLGCGEVDLVGELLEEDRLGDLALGDLVGAAGVDDGDVRDADLVIPDAPFGRTRGCLSPASSPLFIVARALVTPAFAI